MDKQLRNAYSFFRQQAGGIVGENAKTALALAKAEREAEERGWSYGWPDDPEEWDCDCGSSDCKPNEVLCCLLYDAQGEVLESLGSIGDPDRDYSRLIEAELAWQALDYVQRWEAREAKFEQEYSGQVSDSLKSLFGAGLADQMTYAVKGVYMTHQ